MARTRRLGEPASRRDYAEAWAHRCGNTGGTDPYEREQAVLADNSTQRNADGNWQMGDHTDTQMSDEEIFAELGIVVVAEEEAEETEEQMRARHKTQFAEFLAELAQKNETEVATKTTETEQKMEEKKMVATTIGTRANRVVVRAEQDGYVAEFFKTHKSIAVVTSEDTDWHRNKDHNPTQAREDFRTWVQTHAIEFGVAWQPELQQQAWDRKYWKYETDEQVEEDAIELMGWTIKTLCEKVGLKVSISQITLDSIVPMDSPLTYVENGKYTKNGNWAVAQVNLDVTATIDETEINIIYPIEMRSGQLTKIKLTKDELKAMVADNKVA